MVTKIARKMPIEKMLLAGFAIVLLIVLSISFIAYQNVEDAIQINQKIIQTQSIINNLEELRADLWVGISNYQGYSINQNKQFPREFNRILPIIHNELHQLHKQLADYPIQQQRLDNIEPLVDKLLSHGKYIIQLMHTKNSDKAEYTIKKSTGTVLMEHIAKDVDTLEQQQNKQIDISLTKVQKHNQQIYISIIFAFIIQLIILSLLYYFVYLNLHQRNQAETVLRKSEERFQNVAKATNDVVWDWDLTTNELWFNENLQTVYNYTAKEIDNHINWWIERIHEEDKQLVQDSILTAIEKGNHSWSGEYRFRRGDSHYTHVYDRGYITYNDKGQAIRMFGAMMDITQQKKVEELKNEFISSVSHELRTPLTSIRGSIGLLQGNAMGEMPTKAKKLLDIAYHNCERLIRLINDILDIEKIEAGKMAFNNQPIEISSIVKEAIIYNEPYATKFGVSLILEQPLPNAIINADYDRLMQVITNLLSNAVKFSPTGAKVVINVSQVDNKVTVKITDQGKGIPEKFHDHIFQKFAQADNASSQVVNGTGLGLSISHAIIEELGGKIGFTSKINRGSSFYFELPVYNPTQSEILSLTGADNPAVLICEDDHDLANLLSTLLNADGFQVDIAYTAEQAKKLLAHKQYQALTLDLTLPDQSGISLIRELRQNTATKTLPIIIISGKAQEGRNELQTDNLTIVDWLDKPLDINHLTTAVNLLKTSSAKTKLNILFIDDDNDIVQIVSTLLQDIAHIKHTSTLQQANQLLEQELYELIILDLSLPDGSGTALLPMLAEKSIPVIVFSAYELDNDYAKYVSKALVKSQITNQQLLNIIRNVKRQSKDLETVE